MGTLLLSLFLQSLMVLMVSAGDDGGGSKCPNAFWVFGDSLSDTGNAFAAFPYVPSVVLNYPYGESYTFNDKPGHNRFCDGRVVIDFFNKLKEFKSFLLGCQTISLSTFFGFPFFGSYEHVLNAADYTRGANFAYAGATASADTTRIPFFLQLQLNQFFYFKNVTLTPFYPQGLYAPHPDTFTNGAYIIPEIGANDFANQAVVYQKPPSYIIQTTVPQTVAAVASAIVQLHASGARLIIVFNVPPIGCAAQFLTLFGNFSTRDAFGCLDSYNAISRAYNSQLNQTVMQLQRTFNDGTQIIQFDYYNAIINILLNAATYGFNPNTLLQACCGYGGPYNYNPDVTCGHSGFVPPNSNNLVNINTACANPQAAAQWDGVHFTQAFYRQISKFFLTGQFVYPSFNLSQICGHGSFEKF